ncbi:MAG: restriction endonuclease subunit S [Campylobacterota bacterium]|nr:restriction endonuclease subunit S [Campylobacterota bacterium]
MSKNINIPKLRFNEFSGDWEQKKLGDIFKITAGGDIKPENVQFLKDKIFKYPIYANAEKNKGFYGYSDIYKVDSNVITIAGRGVNLGIAHKRKHKFYPIVRLLVLNQKIENNIEFFEYLINNLNIIIESTGVPQLTAPQISTYKVTFPSKQEQEKIASFLTSVDTKIEQLTKKETLLKEYKKGVMQKIFNQEIRFSPKGTSSQAQGETDDGSEFGDWEEKKLGEIVNRYDNLRIPISSSNRISGNTPYYGANGIQDYIQGFTHEGEFILIAEDGANDLRNYPIQYVNGKIWVNNHAHVLQAKKDVANNKFLKYSFSKINIEPFLVGGGRAKLNANIMMKINTLLPCIEEQIKIANFLSSIDKKIELVTTQLNQTKEFKKGLLQQMFV